MYTNTKGEKIYFSSALTTNSIFDITMIGETANNPDFAAMHKTTGNLDLDKYTFEYVCEGIGYIETSKKTYTVKAGDIFILNRTTTHYYYSDPDSPIKKRYIVCYGTLIDALMSIYGIQEGTVVKALDMNAEFAHLINTTIQFPNYMFEEASALILKMLQRVSSVKQANKETDIPLHLLITKYIHENINYSLTADDICDCFDVSMSTLFRIFSKHFKVTPHQFIINAKMEEAKRLLSSTTLPVGDIAARLSYSYQNNFSAIFTKNVGMSPREYRKQNPLVVQRHIL